LRHTRAISRVGASALRGHEKIVRQHGVSAEVIQTVVRIASVVRAAAAILDGEEAIGTPGVSLAAE
jgi:hypothetical protein